MNKLASIIGGSTLTTLLIASCGGNSALEDSSSTIRGQVVDEPIEGLIVKDIDSGSISFTNANGSFEVIGNKGDILEFYIGDIKIGEFKAISQKVFITPIQMNLNNWKVITALLRDLDENKDLSDGIQLPKKAELDSNLSIDNFSLGNSVELELAYGNETENITVMLDSANIPNYLENLGYFAEVFNLLQIHQNKKINLLLNDTYNNSDFITPVPQELTYTIGEIHYNSTNPLNSYIDFNLHLVFNLGGKDNSNITCSSSNGTIKYYTLVNNAIKEIPVYNPTEGNDIIGITQLNCKGIVTDITGEGQKITYELNGTLNGILRILPQNIYLNNNTINAVIGFEGNLTMNVEGETFNLPINELDYSLNITPKQITIKPIFLY